MSGGGERSRAAPTVALWRTGDRPEMPPPRYMTDGAAGCDLAAALDAPLELAPGARALVPTGWAIALPPGLEGQVRPRSGLAVKKGLTVVNAPGTIDSDYRGEIRVALINLGDSVVRIEGGDRIAQLVVAPVVRVDWQLRSTEEVEVFETRRGAGGFGHTGVSPNESEESEG